MQPGAVGGSMGLAGQAPGLGVKVLIIGQRATTSQVPSRVTVGRSSLVAWALGSLVFLCRL